MDFGRYVLGTGTGGTVWTPKPDATYVLKKKNESTPGSIKHESDIPTCAVDAIARNKPALACFYF
jgi:hypothetical protein